MKLPVPQWAVLVGVLLCCGCTAVTDRGYWGAGVQWPNGQRLRDSAIASFKDPQTWVPLAGAAVIGIAGVDDDIADWAADETPLFGSDAETTSDRLRTLNTAAWVATTLAVPSDSITNRGKGILVDLSTLALETGTVSALKSLSDRERPDGSDDRSFPSGHTSRASVTGAMAAANLAYVDMPGWARQTMKIGLYGVAAGTGWARVEAEKHYPTDVLVGYAIGQFLARFLHGAFFNPATGGSTAIQYRPLPGGGAVTLSRTVR